MNYAQQASYLRSSRVRAFAIALALLVLAAACVVSSRASKPAALVLFGLMISAIAVSVCYTSDYLHLTVNFEKAARWEIKIRWRVIACVLGIGLLLSSRTGDVLLCLLATGWLT